MKFFVTNDLKKEHPLKIMISVFIGLIILFVVSDLLVKASLFGTSVNEVYLSLMGDVDNFTEPYAFGILLEMVHTDLFFFTLLFLILAALSFRVSKESSVSKVMILLFLVMIILSNIFPFIALNGSLFATTLWFYSFILSHAMSGFIVIHILWLLWFTHD